MKDSKGLLKIREAALLLGVNPETLRRWDRDGILVAVKVGKRGDRRYKTEDIQKFIEKSKK
jgi:excisionase family DNA binding protein